MRLSDVQLQALNDISMGDAYKVKRETCNMGMSPIYTPTISIMCCTMTSHCANIVP